MACVRDPYKYREEAGRAWSPQCPSQALLQGGRMGWYLWHHAFDRDPDMNRVYELGGSRGGAAAESVEKVWGVKDLRVAVQHRCSHYGAHALLHTTLL